MTYPLGGDSSNYSYVSFAISLLMSVLLSFVWREQLIHRVRDLTRIRQFLMTASLWTVSASALGQMAFSSIPVVPCPASRCPQRAVTCNRIIWAGYIPNFVAQCICHWAEKVGCGTQQPGADNSVVLGSPG